MFFTAWRPSIYFMFTYLFHNLERCCWIFLRSIQTFLWWKSFLSCRRSRSQPWTCTAARQAGTCRSSWGRWSWYEWPGCRGLTCWCLSIARPVLTKRLSLYKFSNFKWKYSATTDLWQTLDSSVSTLVLWTRYSERRRLDLRTVFSRSTPRWSRWRRWCCSPKHLIYVYTDIHHIYTLGFRKLEFWVIVFQANIFGDPGAALEPSLSLSRGQGGEEGKRDEQDRQLQPREHGHGHSHHVYQRQDHLSMFTLSFYLDSVLFTCERLSIKLLEMHMINFQVKLSSKTTAEFN